MSQRQCYFFGTFNPIHAGHLLMAQTALSQFEFEQIIFIPAYIPPHRPQDSEMASFMDRLKMVELACQNNPCFQVSPIESLREGPSYTIETLRVLVPDFEQHATPIPMIIGTDALRDLGHWCRAEILIEKVQFLQAPRESASQQTEVLIANRSVPIQTCMLDMPYIDVSSTLIRSYCKNGQNIAYLTPAEVARYIAWNGLYT